MICVVSMVGWCRRGRRFTADEPRGTQVLASGARAEPPPPGGWRREPNTAGEVEKPGDSAACVRPRTDGFGRTREDEDPARTGEHSICGLALPSLWKRTHTWSPATPPELPTLLSAHGEFANRNEAANTGRGSAPKLSKRIQSESERLGMPLFKIRPTAPFATRRRIRREEVCVRVLWAFQDMRPATATFLRYPGLTFTIVAKTQAAAVSEDIERLLCTTRWCLVGLTAAAA